MPDHFEYLENNFIIYLDNFGYARPKHRMSRNSHDSRIIINLFDLEPSGYEKDSADSCQILRSDSKIKEELMESGIFV